MFLWPPNYDYCYTIAGNISREGVGLHSGEKTRVKISPYEKEGYFVSFADNPDEIFKLSQNLIGSTMLCTAIKLGGRNLYTIEHLLASLAGCGLSYIHIEVDGKEIPLLDGSAIQWVKAFEEVGIRKVPKPDNFHREINKSMIFYKDKSVAYASSHEFPLFPGTGSENETGVGNIYNATLKAGTKSKEFFEIFENKILKPLDKFKPEVVLISAGFDAHIRDPLANINLVSEDFFNITKKIVEIADIHSNGRIISFLEGGYDLIALSESIIEHLKALKTHV